MDQRKIIPIFMAFFLLLVAFVLFKNNKKNNKIYSELVIEYKEEETRIDRIVAGSIYHVGDIVFEVVSAEGNKIVLLSSEDLIDGNSVTNEIELKLKKEKNVCISQNDCYTLSLK